LRQLERFAEGGIRNVVILNLAARAPIHGKDADDPPLFSDAWWDLLREVCKVARERGITIWFYDQIGFSGANFQGRLVTARPEFAGQWLESRVAAAEDAQFPDDCVPLAAFSGNQRLVIHGGRVRAEGPVRLVYAVRRGFDYLNRAACAALFDAIHGEYERRAGDLLGTAIGGSVQDEMPSIPTWTQDFAEAFLRIKGYDLMDHLCGLWDGDDATARRVRYDFHDVRARLAEAAFFKPAFEWHERHGMQCTCDPKAHARKGNPIGCVETYADLHRCNRWYAAPGCDHHGHGRVHASLAWLHGRKRVWLEAFYASGWGGTLEDTFDWLLPWFQAGVNFYNPHAVYYSTQAGNWEWAAPSTCWRQPYWRHYHVFSDTIARLCKVLAQGVPACEVGILYPTSTVQAGATLAPYSGPPPDAREGWFSDLKWEPTAEARKADEVFRELIGKMEWMRPVPGPLDRACVEYLVLDDHSLESASVRNGRLEIAGASLRVVLLPACHTLAPRTADLLAEFVKSGGELIAVESAPEEILGGNEAALDLRVCGLDEVEDLMKSTALLPCAPVPTLHRREGDWHFLYVPAAYPRATELILGKTWYGPHQISLDHSAWAEEMRIELPLSATDVRVWEPFAGSMANVEVTPGQNALFAKVRFDHGPAAVLLWRGHSARRHPEAGSSTLDQSLTEAAGRMPAPRFTESLVIELPQDWTCKILPTVGLPENDLMGSEDLGFMPPQTSFVESCADGKLLQIGFAPRGLQTEAIPAGELPAPLSCVAEGCDPLQSRGWKPAVYSLERGLRYDPCQLMSHGPSGHIAEEFVHFGTIPEGCGAQFRTAFFIEETREAWLVVGSKAEKSAWLNGREVIVKEIAYQGCVPVSLREGWNLLEARVVSEDRESAAAGMFWCLLDNPQGFERPEWISTPAAGKGGGQVVFSREWELPCAVESAVFQIAVAGCAELFVNGRQIGRQGGFDPYELGVRCERYAVENLTEGGMGWTVNLIEIRVDHAGDVPPLMVDAVAHGSDGAERHLGSDAAWRVTAGGDPMPVLLSNNYSYHFNRSHFYLWQRKHPLGPHALSLQADASPGARGVERFRWTIPPGARRMNLAVYGKTRLWIDGEEVACPDDRVTLPAGIHGPRQALLEVETASPARGAAAFRQPITYECGKGRIALGDWRGQGLAEWSGGVAYECVIQRPADESASLVLDLGKVRGTAELFVNGASAGTRFIWPYRFDLIDRLVAGENHLRIEVFNTLAPLFDAISGTDMIHEGQQSSGIFGPVRLLGRS
jgi:hypothetical protein